MRQTVDNIKHIERIHLGFCIDLYSFLCIFRISKESMQIELTSVLANQCGTTLYFVIIRITRTIVSKEAFHKIRCLVVVDNGRRNNTTDSM